MMYRKAWEVSWRRERAAGAPGRYVPAEPSMERLARLRDAHVPLRALARGTGLSATAIRSILDGEHTHVQRRTAARVANLSLARVYGEQARGHVPRIGAQRRIQALMALGWPHEAIAAAGAQNTSNVLNSGGHLMTAARWREVRDVYERLSMTPGPSPETRGWARSLGYAPPLAWDEDAIDDPTAEPQGTERGGGQAGPLVDSVAVSRAVEGGHPQGIELSRPERLMATRRLAAAGASDSEIADRLGVSTRTVLRIRDAEQIPAGRPHAASGDATVEWAAAGGATRNPRRLPDHPSLAGQRAMARTR
ncbi:helix-turn-helix domain-containing protein [Phycicoccus jejuensis]|uniref:helix-turn-helix domain-containing protein n=1 Tax=Phycicoccus jejuensis TaxID=367299 RepID=UPI00384B50C3